MEDRPPYSPSYPNDADNRDDIEEFNRRALIRGTKKRVPLFHDEQQTILNAAKEEVAIRGQVATELIDEIEVAVQEEKKRMKKKRVATGFWIFGHGKKHTMGPEFRNPDMCSKFIISLLAIMIARQLIRQPILSLLLLHKPAHDWLFERIIRAQPILVTAGIYVAFLLISHSSKMTGLIRRYHFHGVLFLLSEITLGVVLLFIALLMEDLAYLWYGTLDTFNDYDEDNTTDRNNWRQLYLTPAVFLVIYDLQISVNITAALLLQAFTPIHVGSHEVYRIMIWLSFFTCVLSTLLVFTSSYGLLPIWDGFQSVLGTIGGLGQSWIFVYKISRLMSGKMVPIDSMAWNDVFYAAYVVF